MRYKKGSSNFVPGAYMRTIFWIAGKNLRYRKLRTMLTMLGIVIGIGAIVFLVSLALGLHQTVDDQVIGSRSVKTIDVTSPNAAVIQMGSNNTQKIANFAHVTAVGRAHIVPGKVSYQGSLSDIVVYGIDGEYLSLSSLNFVAGKVSLQGDHDAIVNTALLSLIGLKDANDSLNRNAKVTINITADDGSIKKQLTEDFNIVGVTSTGAGAEIYTQGNLLTTAGQASYSQLKVVADTEGDIPVIRSQIEGLGLTTTSPIDTLKDIDTVFSFFTLIVAFFGGIGMFVAILGMFNTLTISLLERTSEIGLMISLGARKTDISRMLIFESLLLAVIGGAIGTIGAWALGGTINLYLTHLATSHGVPGSINIFSVTVMLALTALGLSLVVGLLVAIYPARRAARINPIEALKHE